MGFLKLFSRAKAPTLLALPSGSFTVDREGCVMTSTLPRSFPQPCMKEISDCVLEAFRSSRKAQLPLTELVVHYAAFKLLARELRGGAMIFLIPQSANVQSLPVKSH
jgi:hypothetical protein